MNSAAEVWARAEIAYLIRINYLKSVDKWGDVEEPLPGGALYRIIPILKDDMEESLQFRYR